MGICASSHIFTREGGGGVGINWPSTTTTAKVIHYDGRLQEFNQPITAGHVLSGNPNSFLGSSEAMYVGSCIPHVTPDEELHPGAIYFLMPTSKCNKPLSLEYLCALAIKASTALSNAGMKAMYSDNIQAGPRRCLGNFPAASAIRMNSQVARGN